MSILITGITSFVGSHLAARLGAQGHTVRGIARNPQARGHLAAQLNAELVRGDITQPATLAAPMQGVDTVIHLVAIPYERGGATHTAVNAQGTRNVVHAAQQAGATRLIHLSALAADSHSPYPFLRSKGEGEDAVRASGLNWTILRPAVLVGPEDEFANALARWLIITPLAFPLVGDGKARFQPLWIEDLVTCIVKTLDTPKTFGQTYELGGPEHLTYEEMVKQILAVLKRSRLLLHVPVPLIKPVIKGMEIVLPKPPVTTSLLDLLKVDNTTALDAVERHFGFKPRRFRQALACLEQLSFGRALREALGAE